MADDENYDILPHQLLSDLKYDVETLKKKLSEPESKSQELILEIESLKDAVHELTIIFQKALEQSKGDLDFQQLLKNLSDKVNQVADQNETIAKGMVAIAEKVDSFTTKEQPSPLPRAPLPPLQHIMGAPPPMMSGSARVAPRPGLPPGPAPSTSPFPPPSGMGAMDLPPPPPPRIGPKREGLFK